MAVTEERLSELEIQWKDGASCCVVIQRRLSFKTPRIEIKFESGPAGRNGLSCGTKRRTAGI